MSLTFLNYVIIKKLITKGGYYCCKETIVSNMEKNKIRNSFLILFLLIALFYTGVYINAKRKPIDIVDTQYISDISSVDSNNVGKVTKYISYFQLDSNGNFNPRKELTRVDAILIVDKLAKQLINSYNTTKPQTVPYFEDFKSTDQNSDAILRVVNLTDTKKDFYKHYNILGYQLKRQESITQREFLTLLALFFPVDKSLGEDYIIKNLLNYGFFIDGDLNTPITRENAAKLIDVVMTNAK